MASGQRCTPVTGLAFYSRSRATECYFLNALDYPVTVAVNDEDTFTVEAIGRITHEIPTGTVTLKVTGEEGTLLSEEEVDVPSFTSLVAYNVLGAAPLYAEGVIYSANEIESDNPMRVYAGQTFVTDDDVHEKFEPPPEELSVRDTTDRKVRWIADEIEGGFPVSLYLLQDRGELELALSLAQTVSKVSPEDSKVHDMRMQFVRQFGKPNLVKATREELESRFGSPQRWVAQPHEEEPETAAP